MPSPETVNGYLAQLRAALKGAPAGLIADALADCEDHLNSEIAQNPDSTEQQILASVIDTYGTPEEIAEEYRDMEKTISTPFPQPQPQTDERRYGFFNVISDPRTYGALLFMLLALPTGIFYFVWSVVGLSLSLAFSLFWVGIVFGVMFLASIRVLSYIEGRLIEGLLGVRMPRRLPSSPSPEEGIWAKVKDAVTDLKTWSSLLYMILRLPLGIAYFVLAVVGLSTSIAVSGAAIYGLITSDVHIQISDAPYVQHFVHTAPGLAVLAIAGILWFFVVLHIARGIGWLHGKIAEALLVGV